MNLLKEYLKKANLLTSNDFNLYDFRKNIDVVNYDDLYNKINNLYNSGKGFVSEDVIYWAYTSGTTSLPKKIPITESSLDVYKDALSPLFKKLSTKYANEIFDKNSFLPLVGKYHFEDSPLGIKVGCISGLTIYLSYQKYKPFMVYDFLESDKMNFQHRWNLIQDGSRKKSIKWIIATNPAYIYEILKNNIGKESFSIKDAQNVWPKLKIIITMTGSSNKPYIDKLHELFPEIEIWDAGIGASEGYYATTDFKPEPIGQLNNNHYYFEFLALDKKYNDKNTLIFEELKNNSKYQLIVSTPNGFIRYNTQDIFVKENTQIRYIGRNDKTYSFVGERLTEVQITECINQISVEFGNHFNLFKMKFLNNSYTFLFFSQPPFLNEKFINQIGKKIDQFLKESNINYLYAREMYKVLNNPIIEFLPVEYYYSSNVLNSEAKLFRQEKQSLIIQ